MLSTNTLLRNGRYRIGHAISSGQLGAIYTAEDQSTKQQVAVIVSTVSTTDANDGRIENLISLQHDGLVRITDNFNENGHAYKVTEPITELEIFVETEVAPKEPEVAAIFAQLGPIMLALSALRREFPSLRSIQILPENVIKVADGRYKLLFIETPGILFARHAPDSPYLPFERVWNDLDLISQRAFYREFDDAAIESLEAPPDARSDIYSLGAVFYRLLTVQSPLTAFERSFEMIDTKTDPLQALSSLNPAVSQAQSRFVMKMLELKREDRFPSFDEAILSMPSSQNHRTRVSSAPTVEDDDLDLLLEIPTNPQPEQISIAANGNSHDVAMFDELVALSSMEVTSESASHAREIDSFVEQFYSQDGTEDHFAVERTVEEKRGSYSAESVIEKKPEASDFPPDGKGARRTAGSMNMIAVAVAGIVVVAAAGFGLLSLNSSDAAKSQDQTIYQAPAGPVPDLQPQAGPTTEPADQTAIAPPAPSQIVKEQPEPRPTAAKIRPQVAEVKPKPNETRPSAKPEQKPKKKLTVDDLLN